MLLKPLDTKRRANSAVRAHRAREGDGIHFRLPTWVAGKVVSVARFMN